RILTADRVAMSIRMLNSRLVVKNGLTKYGNKPHLVPITKQLLCRARQAGQSYMAYFKTGTEKARQFAYQAEISQAEKRAEAEPQKNLNVKRQGIEVLQDYLLKVKIRRASTLLD